MRFAFRGGTPRGTPKGQPHLHNADQNPSAAPSPSAALPGAPEPAAAFIARWSASSAAVFEAYGWLPTLTDEEILERLVALNAERAAEEARGQIRYLRPDYQCPAAAAPTQQTLGLPEPATAPAPTVDSAFRIPRSALPWPKALPEQVQAVRNELARRGPVAAEVIAAAFDGRRKKQVGEIVKTLKALGQG